MNNYSVLIRTLGTAGDKYLSTLKAIASQTIKPQKVYVVLPYGYNPPKETLGIETYIYVQKGMVAQRAFAFDIIEPVEWVMLLDDDVSFAPDFVERGLEALNANGGDVLCTGTEGGKEKSVIKKKVINLLGTIALTRRVSSRKSDFQIRISHGGGYIVNKNVKRDEVYPTQSGMGFCSICRLGAVKAIHFEEDLWLEKYGYAWPDDQVFFYKMHLMGYKVMILPKLNTKHLDAGAGATPAQDEYARRVKNYRLTGRNGTMFWYLYVYKYVKGWEKAMSVIAIVHRVSINTIIYMIKGIARAQWRCVFAYPTGVREAVSDLQEMKGKTKD